MSARSCSSAACAASPPACPSSRQQSAATVTGRLRPPSLGLVNPPSLLICVNRSATSHDGIAAGEFSSMCWRGRRGHRQALQFSALPDIRFSHRTWRPLLTGAPALGVVLEVSIAASPGACPLRRHDLRRRGSRRRAVAEGRRGPGHVDGSSDCHHPREGDDSCFRSGLGLSALFNRAHSRG